MEFQYFGAGAIKVTTKKSTIVIDPISDITPLNVDLKKIDYVLATQQKFLPEPGSYQGFIVDSPGEYEFSDCSVKGVETQPYTGSAGDNSAVVYRLSALDVTVLFCGHTHEPLSEAQLEEIGTVDVVVVPVGGSGYTCDALAAANLVRSIEPKLVIPVHYNDGLKYQVPQQDLEVFVKELSAPTEQPLEKYKIKYLPEQLTVQPLTRTK